MPTNQDGDPLQLQYSPLSSSLMMMSDMQCHVVSPSSSPGSADSPQRLHNVALSDMLQEFQDEGISSPPGEDLMMSSGAFNKVDGSTAEASILYSAECMEMNNDILDLSKPLPWDRLKKGNSSMSLDSLNDNYIEVQEDEVVGTGEGRDRDSYCTCGENLSPGCPVHRERALLEEEIRTCCNLVKSLKVETPNDNMFTRSQSGDSAEEEEDEDDQDIYSSLLSFDGSDRTKRDARTLDTAASLDSSDVCSTSSTAESLKFDSRSSQSTDKDTTTYCSTNSSSGSLSVPSVHKSDLSSSPESYDLLYKSFEVASLIDKDGYYEDDEVSSPTVTPLEIFNQASPKLQKYLTERQKHETSLESTPIDDTKSSPDAPTENSSTLSPASETAADEGQKVTTFAQLAKTRKKPEVIPVPQTLTVKPTHWSELVANKDKHIAENTSSEEVDGDSSPETPKRPHSLPIQLRFITKPAHRPTQTPEQSLPPLMVAAAPGGFGGIRGVTRTLSAPEGFGCEMLRRDLHHSTETTKRTSEYRVYFFLVLGLYFEYRVYFYWHRWVYVLSIGLIFLF